MKNEGGLWCQIQGDMTEITKVKRNPSKADYAIEKGVSMPPARMSRVSELDIGGRPKKYPFNHMESGDSFFVPRYTRQQMSKACNAGRAYYKFAGLNWIVRARKEANGFRVWVFDSEEV